jgi:hypothetical protein
MSGREINDYAAFLDRKTQVGCDHGFSPVWMPGQLFPFQQSLVEWACVKGRAAIFADCGLGKTFMQLTWAENVARKTGGRVLILTPLAVAFQTVKEGEKIGIEVAHRREGLQAGDRIVVTNYERLHYFNAADFQGVVCDESSILKNFDGETRKAVTEFMRKRPYRLLCTATAAPNDYIELGTSSEALGYLERKHMMAQFFTHDGSDTSKWVLKGHARTELFWRWVCSWARAIQKPSDMGFSDDGFNLPPLNIISHVVSASKPRDGFLFDIPAVGLQEQRADLSNTVTERCDMAARLINAHDKAAVAWCNLNREGDMLAKLIRGAVQVSGSDSEEHKEGVFADFIAGKIRVLVTKPSIGGFGLNLQHCAHQTYFPSHSYEQYYQSVRRCWRFGQKQPVTVDMITTDGQANVVQNLTSKTDQAKAMFHNLVSLMWREIKITKNSTPTNKEIIPSWL